MTLTKFIVGAIVVTVIATLLGAGLDTLLNSILLTRG